jgi:hypothetical protein
MAITLPYYPLSNTGCNDSTKINADFAALIAGIDGSGNINGTITANYLPKAVDADTLTDSIMLESSSKIGLSCTPATAKLEVKSNQYGFALRQDSLTQPYTSYYPTDVSAVFLSNSASGVAQGGLWIDALSNGALSPITLRSINNEQSPAGAMTSFYLLCGKNDGANYLADLGATDTAFKIGLANSYSTLLQILGNGATTIAGALTLSTIAAATTDTDKFLVSDAGVVKFRTGAELLSDIGAVSSVHTHDHLYDPIGLQKGIGVWNVGGPGGTQGVYIYGPSEVTGVSMSVSLANNFTQKWGYTWIWMSDASGGTNIATMINSGLLWTLGGVYSNGKIYTDNITDATTTTDGSLQTDGGLSVVGDAVLGDDLSLLSDDAVLNFGADKDVNLTHVADTGLLLNAAMQLQFRDSAIHIASANDGYLDLTADTGIRISSVIRGATSLYTRYYHMPLSSLAPGASGATWTEPDANTSGGWQLNAATELLHLDSDVHGDWDGATDMTVEVYFEKNTVGGTAGDTADLKLTAYYKAPGDTATKSQVVEVPTVVGDDAQYKQYKVVFTLDWDAASSVIEAGDILDLVLNLETDTSECDDVIVNHVTFHYHTTHVGIETADA